MNSAIGKKNHSGNAFDRFYGLGTLLYYSKNRSVLDIANSDGLVTYEFARHGASVCHGVELDNDRVNFCKRLFRDVPTESHFQSMDLVNSYYELNKPPFLKNYDVVLFLAIYQKIEKKHNDLLLNNILPTIENKAGKFLAIRTNSEDGINYIPKDFELFDSYGWYNDIGPINIFKRKNNEP